MLLQLFAREEETKRQPVSRSASGEKKQKDHLALSRTRQPPSETPKRHAEAKGSGNGHGGKRKNGAVIKYRN